MNKHKVCRTNPCVRCLVSRCLFSLIALSCQYCAIQAQLMALLSEPYTTIWCLFVMHSSLSIYTFIQLCTHGSDSRAPNHFKTSPRPRACFPNLSSVYGPGTLLLACEISPASCCPPTCSLVCWSIPRCALCISSKLAKRRGSIACFWIANGMPNFFCVCSHGHPISLAVVAGMVYFSEGKRYFMIRGTLYVHSQSARIASWAPVVKPGGILDGNPVSIILGCRFWAFSERGGSLVFCYCSHQPYT